VSAHHSEEAEGRKNRKKYSSIQRQRGKKKSETLECTALERI